MSEHLRAFVVIAVLSVMSFIVLHRPVVAMGMEDEDFRRRRNLWLAVTALAFLSSNFWIFMLIAGSLLLFARKERNPFALYLFLLFAVPPFARRAARAGNRQQAVRAELSPPSGAARPAAVRAPAGATPTRRASASMSPTGWWSATCCCSWCSSTAPTRSPTPCARASIAFLDVLPALLRGEPVAAQLERRSRRAAVAGGRGARPGADRGVRVRQALAALRPPWTGRSAWTLPRGAISAAAVPFGPWPRPGIRSSSAT